MAEFSTVRGTRMRVTLVDECGIAGTGAGESVVTDGFVTVSYSPEIEDRDEILLKNAGGAICVNDTTSPQLKWYNLEVEFCKVSPDLFALMTGQVVIDDYDSAAVGIEIGSTVAAEGFALEVWTEIPGAACTGESKPYGYFLVPWAGEGIFDDFTIENDAITFTISARSFNQSQWGTGPYDVQEADAGGTPGPLLTAVSSTAHLRLFKTLVAPPAVSA
jgi:hypothetical protein